MAEFVINFGGLLELYVTILNEFSRIVGEFRGNNCEENLRIFWVNFGNFRNVKILRKVHRRGGVAHMGSSTETVAFQAYEILKIDHEFLQLFWLESKI